MVGTLSSLASRHSEHVPWNDILNCHLLQINFPGVQHHTSSASASKAGNRHIFPYFNSTFSRRIIIALLIDIN